MTEAKTAKKKAPAAKKAAPKKAVKKAKAPQSGPFAVVETGGKQYLVEEGQTIRIERIVGLNEGDKVNFDKVMLKGEGESAEVGMPFLDKAVVSGTVTKAGRGAKVIVIKYKQKSRYHKKNGHRQEYFDVLIESIK